MTILWFTFLFLWDGGGGGQNIKYNILTPLQKYSRTVFVHGIQWTQYQCWYFKKSLGGCGVKILWYNILIPPPGCHWIQCTNTILEYFLEWGGGGSIYYTIIFWPPTHPNFFWNINIDIVSTKTCNWGRNDKAKLSLDSALKLSFLYIIEGGGC